jgi:hypothetical protein
VSKSFLNVDECWYELMAELGTVEIPDLARIAKFAAVPNMTGAGPKAATPLITACIELLLANRR